MRIECKKCGELVPIGTFEASKLGIRVTCCACKEMFFVPSTGDHEDAARSKPERAAAAIAEAAGPDGCPKCSAPLPEEAVACGQCGLSRDHFATYRAEEADEASERLFALWAECRSSWEKRGAHDQFLEQASVERAFRFAAARYREAERERPGDAIAAEGKARVTKMAEAAILAPSTQVRGSEPEEPFRKVAVFMLVLVVLAAGGGIYLMVRGDDGDGLPGHNKKVTPATEKQRSRAR